MVAGAQDHKVAEVAVALRPRRAPGSRLSGPGGGLPRSGQLALRTGQSNRSKTYWLAERLDVIVLGGGTGELSPLGSLE